MHYKIYVEQIKENPNYAEEMKAWKEESKYRHIDQDRWPHPQPGKVEGVLTTIVNEEQFKAMQKSILETFK